MPRSPGTPPTPGVVVEEDVTSPPKPGLFARRMDEIGGANFGTIQGGGTHLAGLIHSVSLAQHIFGDGVERVLARCDAYSGFGFCGALFLAIAQPPCRVLASRHAARHSFIHTNTESIAALTSPRWAKHRVLQATRQSLAVNALQ